MIVRVGVEVMFTAFGYDSTVVFGSDAEVGQARTRPAAVAPVEVTEVATAVAASGMLQPPVWPPCGANPNDPEM
ncbi:hypothetical protein Microterr_27120 [Microbacterium terricola]|uniref:Uncharacterized protein n=1 Tax=Microbacterium terricola TaxID=344163 RepID=A0ABM8E2Q5_9MICO|nr:hypothetical protein Microterr_27120 [Microbacterium terricola]